jgi:hypothetical protein
LYNVFMHFQTKGAETRLKQRFWFLGHRIVLCDLSILVPIPDNR